MVFSVIHIERREGDEEGREKTNGDEEWSVEPWAELMDRSYAFSWSQWRGGGVVGCWGSVSTHRPESLVQHCNHLDWRPEDCN